ncbi:MAG: hypothetical protein LBM01_01395 [Christensenellaceae bacterium]|nr:hypothetical protein [Christensenellaceae bacterium]
MENFTKEYEKMVEVWGEESQIDMALEEMAELTQALCKYKRIKKNYFGDADVNAEKAKKNADNINEEIADVINMVAQLRIMFDTEKIDEIRKEKIDRTMKFLEEQKSDE